jgi:hypothetical protein
VKNFTNRNASWPLREQTHDTALCLLCVTEIGASVRIGGMIKLNGHKGVWENSVNEHVAMRTWVWPCMGK